MFMIGFLRGDSQPSMLDAAGYLPALLHALMPSLKGLSLGPRLCWFIVADTLAAKFLCQSYPFEALPP